MRPCLETVNNVNKLTDFCPEFGIYFEGISDMFLHFTYLFRETKLENQKSKQIHVIKKFD